jgi:hypothetical protein
MAGLVPAIPLTVMPALVAGIHVFTTWQTVKTWMPGTRMTKGIGYTSLVIPGRRASAGSGIQT